MYCDEIKRVVKIKGYLGKEECVFLSRLTRRIVRQFEKKAVFCEIGSFYGKSTICIANVLRQEDKGLLYAIDWHFGSVEFKKSGDPCDGSSYEEYLKNLKEFGVEEKIVTIKEKSDKAPHLVPNNIHLLWIDGAHDYESVRSDYENYQAKIAEGGFLLFHDACWTRWAEPFQFIKDYVLDSDDYNLYAFLGNTMVFKKEKNKTPKILRYILRCLCSFVNGEKRSLFRRIISHLCFRMTSWYVLIFDNWKDKKIKTKQNLVIGQCAD